MGAVTEHETGRGRNLGRCVALMLSVHAILCVWIGLRTCPNRTEVAHMAATLYSWRSLRFDVYNVNPPLTRMLTALPVALCNPRCDWDRCRHHDRPESEMGDAFLAANDSVTVRWCFVFARWALIPWLILGGYAGFRLTCDMFGQPAALIFLTLWCFSPFLLSWEATICPDGVAAAMGLLAVHTFHQWLRGPTWARVTLPGICLGALPLTKLTWILAFGIWPLIWAVWSTAVLLERGDRRSIRFPPLRQLAIILAIALFVVNLGYLFDGTGRSLGDHKFSSRLFSVGPVDETRQSGIGNRFEKTWFAEIPSPFPTDFLRGIDAQRLDFELGMSSYLLGKWADHGWWYYYLYALAVKVPLGTWGLIVLASATTVLGHGYNASWRSEMVVLVPGLALLFFVSSQTGFSVHTRYVIPALPFLLVWTSKVGRAFEHCATWKGRVLAVSVVGLTVLSVMSSLWTYPHYLAYFNESIGGPRNGGKHLLGSNVDWGQDLFYLARWLRCHPDVSLDGLAYNGSYPPSLAGIADTPYPPISTRRGVLDSSLAGDGAGPRPGWYALSVNFLYARNPQYRYFLRFDPAAMAGYSIYVYCITLEDANRVRREMGMPVLPEGSIDAQLAQSPDRFALSLGTMCQIQSCARPNRCGNFPSRIWPALRTAQRAATE